LPLPFGFSFFISFLLSEHDQPLIFESSLFSLLPLSLFFLASTLFSLFLGSFCGFSLFLQP
jgi:hypothetical protein